MLAVWNIPTLQLVHTVKRNNPLTAIVGNDSQLLFASASGVHILDGDYQVIHSISVSGVKSVAVWEDAIITAGDDKITRMWAQGNIPVCQKQWDNSAAVTCLGVLQLIQITKDEK